MRILLTGATGFIGMHLAHALQLTGHRTVLAVRDVERARRRYPMFDLVHADFSRDIAIDCWLSRLERIDAVINSVGLFKECGEQRFATLHARGPSALFEACARVGVTRVIQISALGAAADAPTEFLRSKNVADDLLLRLPLRAVVLQPSLVFGANGASARLFAGLAALPLTILPDGGTQSLQPVHIDDLVAAVLRLLDSDDSGRIAAVGPQPLSLRDYLDELRRQMNYRGTTRVVPISSRWLENFAATLPVRWLQPDALRMLNTGSVAPPSGFARVLGRPARPPAMFIDDAAAWRRRMALDIALPALRCSIALLWIATGVLSLGAYPVADSLELLARSGVPETLREPALYGAASLDIALGFGVLVRRWRPWLWCAQTLLIVVYTFVITLKLPEFWLHPYAPILKNIPLVAAIAVLQAFEGRRR